MAPLIRPLRCSIPHRALSTSPYASAPRIASPVSGSIPTTKSCPPSGCACAAMPAGLDIDYQRELNGTMPPYTQHVVVRTGKFDWARKIEDEDEDEDGVGDLRVNFARRLKGLVGRGGKFFDPDRPVLITNSSLGESPDPEYTSVDVFPQNVNVPRIRHSPEAHETFVQQFIDSKGAFVQKAQSRREGQSLGNGYDKTGSPIPKDDLVDVKSSLTYTENLGPTILICGHGTRDTRCGTLGSILQLEFNNYIYKQPVGDINLSKVALTSHIGGHAFAGNVVIYLPKTFKMPSGELSPLAGMGIWYGRVEPRHVWGIMEETVQRGSVIQELLRGIHRPFDIGGYDGIGWR